jgi:hypothetical protein
MVFNDRWLTAAELRIPRKIKKETAHMGGFFFGIGRTH